MCVYIYTYTQRLCRGFASIVTRLNMKLLRLKSRARKGEDIDPIGVRHVTGMGTSTQAFEPLVIIVTQVKMVNDETHRTL